MSSSERSNNSWSPARVQQVELRMDIVRTRPDDNKQHRVKHKGLGVAVMLQSGSKQQSFGFRSFDSVPRKWDHAMYSTQEQSKAMRDRRWEGFVGRPSRLNEEKLWEYWLSLCDMCNSIANATKLGKPSLHSYSIHPATSSYGRYSP
jgi:hypothetical protein